jgi:uncharacterized protein (TIGR02147 family)
VAAEQSARPSQPKSTRRPRIQRRSGDGIGAHLGAELERRCKTNPRYSLRAFARSLSMEPSYLSKVIRGERAPTASVILRAGTRLGIDPIRLRDWIEATTDRAAQELQRRRESMDKAYVSLTDDQLAGISEWYYYAIPELFDLEGFECTPERVAGLLGLRADVARDAIERMIRLGMLARDAQGRITEPKRSYTMSVVHPGTGPALRKFQRQILEKAIDALEEVPFEERSQSSVTLAVDSERLDAARELIQDFRRKFAHLMKASREKDRVYHLNVSFYPVTPRAGRKRLGEGGAR